MEQYKRYTGNINNSIGHTVTPENEKCIDKYFLINNFLYDTYADDILR